MSGLIVDLFAGGGGASTGIEQAMGRSPSVALNHSWDALRNHALNHPDTRHLVDDIRSAVPLVVTGGAPVDLLWASPDCKHFSRCKGGKPLDESVRTLPWEIVRWAKQTRPRLIAVENVPEMTTWGPLDAAGHPIKSEAGTTFAAWVQAFRDLGYKTTHGILKACDYGTPTIRKRLFFIARLDAQPVLPAPTHGPGLLPYRTAAECLDWSDLGTSIFDRDLADATNRRIAKGLVQFVLQAKRPYLVQTGYGERAGQSPRTLDPNLPLGTIVAGGSKAALVTAWVAKHYTGVTGVTPGQPLGTIKCVDSQGLCVAELDGQPDRSREVAAFLTTYYGQSVGQSVDTPLGTVTTHDRHGLVTVQVDGVSRVVTDVRMRMLKASELKVAQGFPASYRLEGSAKLQVRLIGNSVPPQLAAAVVAANTTHRPVEGHYRRAIA